MEPIVSASRAAIVYRYSDGESGRRPQRQLSRTFLAAFKEDAWSKPRSSRTLPMPLGGRSALI